MKKYLFFAAIAIAALVSCQKEIAKEEVTVKPGYVQLTLTAQSDIESKASLNGKQVVWEVGEKVAVFTAASVEPNEFTVTGVEGTTVKIWGEVPDGTTSFVAAYPYENAVSWDKASVVNMKVDNQSVSSPTAPISVDPKALASVAYFADATATPTFKNTLALLKFSVGADGVKKVKISAESAGALAGEVSVTVAADADPVVAGASIPSIEVACDEGFTKDAVYYAAVAPGAYTGFSVRTYVGEDVKLLYTDATGEIKRNDVLALGDVATNAKVMDMLFEITNAEELALFLKNAHKYKADEVVKLMNDIDLTGATLTSATTFAGTFDGQGFSLKNWTSNGTALFAENKGTVKDITLDASCQLSLPAEITNFAFVVVSNLGRVCGITNNANISGSDVNFKGGRLGAIVGVSTSPSSSDALTIENCVNNGDMIITTAANTGGTQYVGTIVGSMGGSTLNNLSECINNGALSITCSGTNTKNFYMGGVAGGTTNGSNNIKVKNNGDVSFICAGHEAALCLAGVSSYTTGATTDCENTGKITFKSNAALKATFVAGIAGYFASNTMSGCVNRGAVTIEAGYINGRNGIGDINKKSFVGTEAISAGLTIGGLVSATGLKPVFENSDNYGKVSLTLNNPTNGGGSYGIHTAARPSMGGLVGDCSGPMTNCNNYGDVTVTIDNGGTAFTGKNAGYTLYVGGIVGSSYNWSGASTSGGTNTNSNNKFTLDGCNNSGNVTVYTDNNHTTNHAYGGIVGWPQSEDKTAVYVAHNCHNTGNVIGKGNCKCRLGGIHGGTGRMDGCSNTGTIKFESGQSGSVLGSLAGFHSQAHTLSNCSAEGSVIAEASCTALGGLVGNLGNVAFTGMDGCSVNCKLSGGPADGTGLVVGLFNGSGKAITLGSSESPIGVYGSVDGVAVDATNFESLIHGSKNFSATDHTIYTAFQVPVFIEDLANNKFTYHGKEYPIVKLADGRWWMAAPMAYVPEGKTVSSDPAEDAGIWYTYTIDSGVATPATSVEGYLYDFPTALGKELSEITYGTQSTWQEGNYRDFEGAQGICPRGWYIPTYSDFLKLVGAANADVTRGLAAADDPTALYYVTGYKGSSITRFNEVGWNFSFLGARNKTSTTATGSYNVTLIDSSKCNNSDWYGKPALNQIMTSTVYRPNAAGTSFQVFSLMSTFTSAYPEGRLMLSYAQYVQGVELRCIRKAD